MYLKTLMTLSNVGGTGMRNRAVKTACLVSLAFVMTVGVNVPTVIFASDYASIDVDSWDYNRAESLENQISVQGDVEYEPPDDLDTSGRAELNVDYSNQMSTDSEIKKPESEIAAEAAVSADNTAVEEQEARLFYGWFIIGALVIAAVGIVAGNYFKRKREQS